jgi:peptidoglycan-associated lipoprotein
MRFNTKPAVTLAAIALAAALSACASKPKPAPAGPETSGPPAAEAPAYQPPTDEGAANRGRPTPGSVQDFVINVGDRVYFDFDSYQIRGDAQPVLDQQSAWLARYPAVKVRIEGNCDERGTREYNLALGARRANAVREYLTAHGVSPARIETISYGKERPIDGGSGEEAWAKNRNGHTAITEGARGQ